MRRLSGDKKMPVTDSDYLKWIADNLIKYDPGLNQATLKYVTGDNGVKRIKFVAQRRMTNEVLLKGAIQEAIRKDKWAERT